MKYWGCPISTSQKLEAPFDLSPPGQALSDLPAPRQPSISSRRIVTTSSATMKTAYTTRQPRNPRPRPPRSSAYPSEKKNPWKPQPPSHRGTARAKLLANSDRIFADPDRHRDISWSSWNDCLKQLSMKKKMLKSVHPFGSYGATDRLRENKGVKVTTFLFWWEINKDMYVILK